MKTLNLFPVNLMPKVFKKRAKLVHGDQYDYSKVKYESGVPSVSSVKVTIVCPDHGPFQQSYLSHVSRRYGCNKCARKKAKATMEKRAQEVLLGLPARFEKEGKNTHGNKYDYSKLKIDPNQKGDQKLEVVCPTHGSFFQSIHVHRHHGCASCAAELKKQTNREFGSAGEYRKEFLRRAKEVHGSRYDYSKVRLHGWKDIVAIVCPDHGPFEQIAHNHVGLRHGCNKCLGRGYTSEEYTNMFLAQARRKYGKEYSYKKVSYKTNSAAELVTIVCRKHGPFRRNRREFIDEDKGCPSCSQHSSGFENYLARHLKEKGLRVKRHVKGICRSTLTGYPLEVDMVLPDVGVAIEYGGLYWHSTLAGKHKTYHRDKYLDCKSKGLKLLTIFDRDVSKNRDAVFSRIINATNTCKWRVFARDCSVRVIPNSLAKKFCARYHTQGWAVSSVSYGLYLKEKDKDRLVSVMSFAKSRYRKEDRAYEMMRFCSRKNYSVVGGMSKLFAAFIRQYSPNIVVSYADLRWGDGHSYTNLGFELVRENPPTPFYLDPLGKLWHRSKVMKHKLPTLLPHFDASKTQDENLFDNGWDQYYDCGQATYLWRRP